MSVFATIEEGIEEIRQGRVLLVVDDEDRENEGDLVMAADKVTPEAVNFMAMHGRGLICVPMTGERLDELKLGMMVTDNTAPLGTAFTVSVDARRGVTTGTSAYDRAVTTRTLVDPQMGWADLTTPGHMFPLRAMEGGVLRRAGHTEAAVDLARLAGCYPAGVICEVLDESGHARRTCVSISSRSSCTGTSSPERARSTANGVLRLCARSASVLRWRSRFSRSLSMKALMLSVNGSSSRGWRPLMRDATPRCTRLSSSTTRLSGRRLQRRITACSSSRISPAPPR